MTKKFVIRWGLNLFDKGHQSHRVLESAGVQIISSYNEFFKFVGDYYA